MADSLLDKAVRTFAAKVEAGDWQGAEDFIRTAALLAGVEPATVPPDDKPR